MPKWKATVKIGDLHQQYEAKKIDLSELAIQIKQRLGSVAGKFEDYAQEELLEIIEKFDDVQDVDQYDEVLEEVYGWADEYRLWVDTTYVSL